MFTVLILVGGLSVAYLGVTLALHVYRMRTDHQYRHDVDEELHERRLLQAYRSR